MHHPMLETRAGAIEPCRVAALLPDGTAAHAPAALTREQRRLVDGVNVRDSRWFARHPDRAERVRPIIRGEFASLVEEPTWTHVRVLRVGSRRARLPFAERGGS